MAAVMRTSTKEDKVSPRENNHYKKKKPKQEHVSKIQGFYSRVVLCDLTLNWSLNSIKLPIRIL